MEAEREELLLRALEAEASIDFLTSERDSYRALFESALENERAARSETTEAVKYVADHESILKYGRSIFGVLPSLPEKAMDEAHAVPKRRIQAREAVRMRTQEFFSKVSVNPGPAAASDADFFNEELKQEIQNSPAA